MVNNYRGCRWSGASWARGRGLERCASWHDVVSQGTAPFRRGSSYSIFGVMESRQLMNTYGARAMTYWQTWLPNRYQQIQDPESFFADLGEQVADLISDGCLEWESRERQTLNGLGYLQRVGRLNAIRMSVTEQVMTDLVLLDPEPQTVADDQESPPTWVDPLSEWVDQEGMPVDPTHPLHRMLEDDRVSPQQYREALQEFWAQVKREQPDPR